MKETGIESIIDQCREDGMELSRYHIHVVAKLLKEEGDHEFADYLTEWEYGYLNRLKIPKRKADFLSGRLAGKEAVIAYMDGRGIREKPGIREIEIRRTDTGEPEVLLEGKQSDILVSITHSGDLAFALVCGSGEYRRIGIDVEKIEERQESFLKIAFGEEEMKDLEETGGTGWNHNRATLYWTLKEAVLKSIGSGLNHNLKDIAISWNGGSVSVELKRDVRKRFFDVCSEGPFIKYYHHGGYMISISAVK